MTDKDISSIYTHHAPGDVQSVELEEYGVWVKSEPEDFVWSEDKGTQGSESDFLSEIPVPEEPQLQDFDDLSTDGESLNPITLDDEPVEGMSEEEPQGETPEDVDTLLQIEPIPQTEPKMEKIAEREDISTQLLMKIADELSSIRRELTSLKKEFGFLGKVEIGTPGETGKTLPASDREESPGGDGRGLSTPQETLPEESSGEENFDLSIPEEALAEESTGLNLPAEPFPEEAFAEESTGLNLPAEPFPEEAFAEESTGLNLPAEPFPEEILPERGEVSDLVREEPIPDLDSFVPNLDLDFNLEEEEKKEPDDTIPLDVQLKENEELKKIMEEGVKYFTSAPSPEDTQFLEADPLASTFESEEKELLPEDMEESLDFSNAVIDEPDLGEVQENPLREPTFEELSGEGLELDLSDEELSLEGLSEEDMGELSLEGLSGDDGGEDLSDLSGDETPIDEIPIDLDLESPEEPPPSSPEPEDSLEDKDSLEDEIVLKDTDFFDAIPKETVSPEGASEEIPGEVSLEKAPGMEPEGGGAEEAPPLPSPLKKELTTVLAYMDHLLKYLPDEKIEEFAQSAYFDTYKKLFNELGLV